MNEKEMLMKQLRANAFPHNNGKVMQAINIIRHSYNRLTDVQQAAQIWGVSQDDFLDCINYLAMAKYIQLLFADTLMQRIHWDSLGAGIAEGLTTAVAELRWDTLGRVLTDGMRGTISGKGLTSPYAWQARRCKQHGRPAG